VRPLSGEIGSAAWSPDGRALVYTTYRYVQGSGSYGDIWLIAANGTARHRLTATVAFEGRAEWSPDGRAILFVRSEGRRSDVWRMNADGSGGTRLTHDGRSALGATRPAWSPDGRRIAFVSCERRQCKRAFQDVYVMDEWGGRRRRLTWGGDNGWPTWSPNGRLLAYTHAGMSLDLTSDEFLYTIRPDGGGNRRVAPEPRRGYQMSGNGAGFAWSPDSRWIAYDVDNSEDLDGQSEIWLVRTDGASARPLLRGTRRARADDHLGEWSPDGMYLVFTRLRGDRTGTIWGSIHVARRDGTRLRRLTY
jgi:Tol biopolymer transport system component